MSWKNVRFTNDQEKRTVFGTLDFYTDGSIRISGTLSVTDKAKAYSRAVAKNPGAAVTVGLVLIKACFGFAGPIGAYKATKKLQQTSQAYEEEKEEITVLKDTVDHIWLLKASLDSQGETVRLSGDGRSYSVDFSTRFVARAFVEAFRTEAEKHLAS